MKRVMRLDANNDGVSVTVNINVLSDAGRLTTGEHEALKHNITSGVMQVLAAARYLNVNLSEIKVN